MNRLCLWLCTLALVLSTLGSAHAADLRAGAAKVEITDRSAGPVSDPLFAKALVLQRGQTLAVILTIDAVAIGEIGRIKNDFLPNVRSRLQQELGIAPASVLVNASHCHGVVRADTDALAVEAVKAAWANLVPARVGAGAGHEANISENRRLKMKDGSEVDMRRAYALPPDADVAALGPIDPQVGLLRVDTADGKPLAVVYNFACHPIMGVPGGGNTADFPGFASQVIEESLGGGAVALFIQGCGGDINPARYKDIARPHDARPLGNLLGLTVLRAVRQIQTHSAAEIKIASTTLTLPRAGDYEKRITALEAEQARLLRSLKPTDINFKTFLPLLIAHKLSPDRPSFYAQGYLLDESLGRDDLVRLDTVNRANIEAYLQNIAVMEKLTRLNTNLALLKKHQASAHAAGNKELEVEVAGLRVGEFRMVTFPGELTVEVGLAIKKASGHPWTFVAGYTNGYIYYTPTVAQRGNRGYAQEDCDCRVAPEWQARFQGRAMEILKGL